MKSGALDIIPREIIVRALHNCDYITIIRFSLTCKKAHNIIASSVSLQLHIELEINGLEIADGSSKGYLNYSSILKELRGYGDAWLNTRFSSMIRQPIGTMNAEVPNWELRSGIYYGDFCLSKAEYDEDYLVNRVQLATLGSSNLPPPINFEKRFSHSTLDPNQDLVILAEDEVTGSEYARFHLRSITTGQPHPLAEHPIITVSFDGAFLQKHRLSDNPMSAYPEVMGNYLVANIYWPGSDCDISETLLWDWKTGILLSRVYSEFSSARCTFLDKAHLLVYSVLPENEHQSSRVALLVYRIPTMSTEHEVPPNADFRPSLYPKSSPILVFELPELHPSWVITRESFMLGSEPLPGDVVSAKSTVFLCSHITTLGLSFRIWNNPHRHRYAYGSRKGTPTDFRVFISTHYLFTHLSGCQTGDVIARIIPWSQWGTVATRWFIEDDSIEHSTEKVYGSRYIRSTTVKSGESQQISIVDFNAPVIKRHAYISTVTSRPKRASADRAEKLAVLEGKGMTAGRLFQTKISSNKLPIPTVGEDLSHEIVTETIGSDMKTIIKVGFKDPVVSCLPYRVVTKVQRMPRHGHWRIQGEYLVGIPRRNHWGMRNPPLSLYKIKPVSPD